MAIANGPTILSPTGGAVLAEAVFPTPRHLRAHILVTTTYGFDAILEIWDGLGAVVQDLVLKIGQTLWISPQ